VTGERRLWDKGEALDERIRRFTVGRDPELDLRLVAYDCLGSAAHARMLHEIGVLTEEERKGLVRELAAIVRDLRAGEFPLPPELEDGHTAIENRLTTGLGDAGRKIHTGRSRNDQVIAAVRLFAREELQTQTRLVLDTAERLLELAAEHREVAVPGYTHSRQAMTTTLGHFFHAHAEALLDAVPWLETAFAHADRSPLGSASGYGVALPLDRRRVAELLRFGAEGAALQRNTLAVQNDRGRTEWLVLGAVLGPVTDLGRLAADLIAFSQEERGYLRLSAAVTTGSSIMPQKRNPDGLELMRAGAARLRARHAEIAAVFGSLSSGYHRDLQATKEPFLEGMVGATDLLAVTRPVLEGLEVDAERCRAALLPSTAATDEVYLRVARGMPFRTAYRQVATDPEGEVTVDPAEAWRLRTHEGAPGALDTAPDAERLARARERWRSRQQRVAGAWELLAPE